MIKTDRFPNRMIKNDRFLYYQTRYLIHVVNKYNYFVPRWLFVITRTRDEAISFCFHTDGCPQPRLNLFRTLNFYGVN